MNIIYGGCFCFGIGLYIVLQTNLLTAVSLTVAVILLFLALFLGIVLREKKYFWLRNLFLLCFFLLLGIVNGLRAEPSAAERLQPYFGREVIFTGALEPLNFKERNEYISCVLQCRQLQCGSVVKEFDGRVRVSLNKKEISGRQQLFYHPIVVRGMFTQLQDFRNPGSFQGEIYNRVHNLGGRLQKARVVAVNKPAEENVFGRENKFSLAKLYSWLDWDCCQTRLAVTNWRLRQLLQQKLGDRHGALLSSMLLGGSSALQEETRDIFTANGLSHLLSVSGTHLLLLAGFLLTVLRPIAPTKCKLLATLCLCFYALLCGLKPPVLRALVMSTVLLYGGQGGRRGSMLGLTALVLLTFKPLWLLDLSFQLSFGAAAGLIWLLPACQRLCPQWLPQPLTECLGVTLAAQLATLPLLIENFHQLSLISLVSNLLLTPVLEIIALVAILGLLCVGCGTFLSWCGIFAACSKFLGDIFFNISNFLLAQILVQGNFFGRLPYSQIVVGELPVVCVFLYYVTLGIWADVDCLQFFSNRERRALLFCLTAIILALQLWPQFVRQPLTAYFLDVGQGDCVVLVTPEKQIVVYDTGGLLGLDTGKSIVAPFLRSLGTDKVDKLILSHYDYDHVGGAVGLLQQTRVQELVLPQEIIDENNFQLAANIVQAAENIGTKIIFAEQVKCCQLDDASTMNLLVPTCGEKFVTGNDASTIALVQNIYGSILLTGDLSSEKEELLDVGQVTVFKAGHHGSKNSNSTKFLQQIRPQLTVISCGLTNRYGHPHAETLERLANSGSTILRTDLQGCVKIELGEKLHCYEYRQNNFCELQVAN